jgi:hypothetical protein
MIKKITEHDALKGIDNMLEPLSDEERKRVLDWVYLKYKIGTTSTPTGAATINASRSETSTAISGSIKDFLMQKRPMDTYERIACIVYYMEKIQGIEGVKTSQITQGNKDARQAPFSNPAVFVNHAATRHGLLTPMGGRKKALSARGEAVVEALPDRERVNQALSEHPIKKRSAKKSTAKKKSKA